MGYVRIKSKDIYNQDTKFKDYLSNLKTGKVKAIRFSTLDSICRNLECQPGDILEYFDDGN